MRWNHVFALSHIFSLPLNERFTFALKTTLHKDGSPDTGEYEQVDRPPPHPPTLLNS